MSRGQLQSVVQYLRRVTGSEPAVLTDRELLARFAQDGDESAFTVLVQRHGAFVLDVCRRVVGSWHDAEDAMQATFLVLARKAGSIAWHDSVAGWLHEVAVRVASEARGKIARRRALEQHTAVLPETPCVSEVAWHELSSLLDQELRRLPDKYRAPLILCCLEGRSRDEAADQLGWSLGTVKGRLERGREMLRKRLVRRGLTLSAVLGSLILSVSPARAALPAGLCEKVARLAGAFRAGKVLLAGAGSPAALAERVLHVLFLAKLKAVAAVVVALVLVVSGVGMFTQRGAPTAPPTEPPALVSASEVPEPPAIPVEAKELVAEWNHKATVRSLVYTPNGKILATASWDKTIGRWDASSGKALAPCTSMSEHSAVAISPDGKRLFSGSSDGSVSLWDLAEGTELLKWQAAKGHVYGVAFSPNGKQVATALRTGDVSLWDAATGELVRRLSGHVGRAWSVAFAPDGELVATAAEDRLIRVWDMTLGRERFKLTGHREQVSVVQYAPDGRTLLSGDLAGNICIWEAATGKAIVMFGKPGDPVQWLTVTRDGTLAATAHRSGKVYLWSARTGEERGGFTGHQRTAAYGVAFAPDSKRLASSGEDGSVRVWSVAKGLRPVEMPAAAALTKEELTALWEDLASTDSQKAYKAIQRLAGEGKTVVPFLAARLKAFPELDAKQWKQREEQTARLVADLDSADFTMREKASEALMKRGHTVLPSLRKAMSSPSAEVRRRAVELIDFFLELPPDADTLRGLRAVVVLETVGDREARQLLETLREGNPNALLTREAKASLQRLK